MNNMGFENIPQWLQNNWHEHSQGPQPEWMKHFRQHHWDAFYQHGLPTRKNERFKYIDFDFLNHQQFSLANDVDIDSVSDMINQYRLRKEETILLVSVNGRFMPTLSDMAKLKDNVIACRLEQAYEAHQELITSCRHDAAKYPFASLNAAMNVDGLFLFVPDNCQLTKSIHLLSIVIDAKNSIAHPRSLILLGQNSKLSLVEEHFSLAEYDYMMNRLSTIVVGKQAELTHYKIQQEGKQAVHIANTFVMQMQDSKTQFTNFTTGGAFTRDDLIVKLQERGATCQTAGFYHLISDNQFVDYHVDIDHVASSSQSEMLYKGILDNKSRAVFNGKVHVAKDAQKTVAYQANHNLLLSKEAEIYSTPILEIYADDVKCKHGATVGQLDPSALFYLRSRGIEEKEAINILLQGFAEEIFQRVTHPGIKLRVQEMVQSL